MEILEALLDASAGQPPRRLTPGLSVAGSPHATLILIAGMLVFFACAGRAERYAFRERWLLWAFATPLLREAIILISRLHGGDSPPFPGARFFDAWSAHLVLVVLVAAFLRYLLKEAEPARRFLIAGAAILTGAAAVAFLLAPAGPPPPPAPHIGLPPLNVATLHFIGLALALVSFALVRRRLSGVSRAVMLCAVSVFTGRAVLLLGGELLSKPGAPSPLTPLILPVTILGLLLFGYLFIRERSTEMSTDLALLEDKVQDRTQELNDALGRLSQANALLQEQSTIDPLTGARNRRSFDESLSREWDRARRTGAPLAVALVDVDEFKTINDRFGHPVGDDCLVEIAAALHTAARRPTDIVARYGGDEFVVLLPGADAAVAAKLMETVRRRVAGATGVSNAPDLSLSVSVGVYAGAPASGSSPADLIQRADEALYEAKRNGRNRVHTAALQSLKAAV